MQLQELIELVETGAGRVHQPADADATTADAAAPSETTPLQ